MAEQTKLTVAAALASALSLAALASTAHAATIEGMEKCYGIAAKGQNSCANAAGTHSCAGQSTANYDGGDWRVVKAGLCTSLHGKLQPFQGANPAIKS
jgi:uncharacterized membrane protein